MDSKIDLLIDLFEIFGIRRGKQIENMNIEFTKWFLRPIMKLRFGQTFKYLTSLRTLKITGDPPNDLIRYIYQESPEILANVEHLKLGIIDIKSADF